MAAMYGADADELDRLASQFDLAAEQLDCESRAMSGLLNNISWLGDNAGRFVGDWTGVQLPKIGLSTRFLRENAHRLRVQAAQQRNTSAGNPVGQFHVGRSTGPFTNLSQWAPGGTVLPQVPWTWLSHLNVSVGGLVDAIGFDVNGATRDLKFGSLWFGAVGAAGKILEDLFREQGWTEATLAAGLTGVVGEVGSAGAMLAQHLNDVPIGRLGPAFAIVGGVTGFVSEYSGTLAEGADTGSLIKMSGSAITAVGGVLSLVPGAQVIGVPLMVVGAGVSAVGWVVDNWDDISETAAQTYQAVDRWVDDRVDDAANAVLEVGRGAVDAADDTVAHATVDLGRGWDNLRGLF